MGWFSKREREPDAIDRLCDSLRNRRWEWKPMTVEIQIEVANGGHVALLHLTQIGLCWIAAYKSNGGLRNWAYTTVGTNTWIPHSANDSDRLWVAYSDWLAARTNSKKADLGPTAKAMAQAVMDGETQAVFGLTDWVLEHLKGEDGG